MLLTLLAVEHRRWKKVFLGAFLYAFPEDLLSVLVLNCFVEVW
jgi:hypothetical protein